MATPSRFHGVGGQAPNFTSFTPKSPVKLMAPEPTADVYRTGGEAFYGSSDTPTHGDGMGA